jgi:methionyl-tRNA formyltransferase
MRLIFAGTPEVALPSLDALAASPHEIVAVISRPDARAGRGRRPVRSPVALWADERGVEVLTPSRVGDPDFLDRLGQLQPDCCPVVAYGGLVPPVALDVPRHGWVNLHFSLLPAWRGAAPVQRALIAGDEITGATTFRIEQGLDTGPIYGVLTETVRPRDTAGDLLARLADAGAGLLVATMDGIEDGSLRALPQSADGVSHAPRLQVEDARVDWSKPGISIDRLVRACTPAPGTWTLFRGRRLKIRSLSPESRSWPLPPRPLAPGEIFFDHVGVRVGTAGEPVGLGEVQPEGKRAMPAQDWGNGVRPAPGEAME